MIAPAPRFHDEPVAARRLPAGLERVGKARWLEGVPEHKRADLIPPGVFEAWIEATWATDPDAANHHPPMLRAPNGVIADRARDLGHRQGLL